MKISWRHFFTAALAAGLGWLMGAGVSPTSAGGAGGHALGSLAPFAPPGKRSAVSAAELAGRFSVELAAIRAVPGASSEIAWVQWAMGIEDRDIPAAIARLNPKSDFHALRYLYARWTKLDPKAAWASFCQSGIPAESPHFYGQGNQDPEWNTAGRGLQDSNLLDQPRSLIAARMLTCWQGVDPEGAKSMLAKLKDKNSPEAKAAGVTGSYLDYGLDEHNPAATLTADQCVAKAAEVEALTDPDERSDGISRTMAQWMASDPAGACGWFKTLPEQDRKRIYMGQFLGAMNSLPLEERASMVFSTLNGEYVEPTRFDPQQAEFDPTNLAGSRGYDMNQNQAGNLLREWAEKDPAALKGWLNALPENDLKTEFTARAAAAMVAKDQEGAVALLNDLDGNQQQALVTFMSGWASSDAEASLQWAEKIQDAATRDDCLATAAASLSGANPQRALQAAQAIADPVLRGKIFNQVEQNLSWNPAALEQLRSQYPEGQWQAKPDP